MNGTQQPDPLDKLISELKEDFKPLVQKIESGPQLTKGNYGTYMAMLSEALEKGGDKNGVAHARIMALALIRAGASPFGVKSALKILNLV